MSKRRGCCCPCNNCCNPCNRGCCNPCGGNNCFGGGFGSSCNPLLLLFLFGGIGGFGGRCGRFF
ncbi:hypothetical protein [Clostridium mediterraneense]|uniref:hypothetical protein n=1 Tax=Clostridium mediterraneense TaxID=1805472 RepID=UPI000832404C|nr:hypothetical protein [Clostridium mediterraneense]